jgi:hypothetical protein
LKRDIVSRSYAQKSALFKSHLFVASITITRRDARLAAAALHIAPRASLHRARARQQLPATSNRPDPGPGLPAAVCCGYKLSTRGRQILFGDPRGGWVGQSTKKDPGQKTNPDIFLVVFLTSPRRETPKNVSEKKSRKSRFWICGRTFQGASKKKQKTKSVGRFQWNCDFLAYFVKTCCTSF